MNGWTRRTTRWARAAPRGRESQPRPWQMRWPCLMSGGTRSLAVPRRESAHRHPPQLLHPRRARRRILKKRKWPHVISGNSSAAESVCRSISHSNDNNVTSLVCVCVQPNNPIYKVQKGAKGGRTGGSKQRPGWSITYSSIWRGKPSKDKYASLQMLISRISPQTQLSIHSIHGLSSLWGFEVHVTISVVSDNTKKDSDSTPVKGGTDMGEIKVSVSFSIFCLYFELCLSFVSAVKCIFIIVLWPGFTLVRIVILATQKLTCFKMRIIFLFIVNICHFLFHS